MLSGKGGTGKTSIVGSLAVLAENKVMADCDVDAADLHLLLSPVQKESYELYGSRKAVIDPEKCVECGKCAPVCRFDAIVFGNQVNLFLCEGCGVCAAICPVGAITMEENLSGHWFISETRYGPLVHARLGIAEESSGKLVTEVRRTAKAVAEKHNADYIIIDGPPGIGCPVIASMSNVDLALIVTEPTVAGIHDLERILGLASHFQVPALVCINKYDVDEQKAEEIEWYCYDRGIRVIVKIPFDEDVSRAIMQGMPPVEYSQGRGAAAIRTLWEKLGEYLT